MALTKIQSLYHYILIKINKHLQNEREKGFDAHRKGSQNQASAELEVACNCKIKLVWCERIAVRWPWRRVKEAFTHLRTRYIL